MTLPFEQHEQEDSPIEASDPATAIKFCMKQPRLAVREPLAATEQPDCVYAVLPKGRELPLAMIRTLPVAGA